MIVPFILIGSILTILALMIMYLNSSYIPGRRIELVVKQIQLLLNESSCNYSVKVFHDTKEIDIRLDIEDKTYLIKTIPVKKGHSVVITNKTTWIETRNTGSLNLKDSLKQLEPFLTYQNEHISNKEVNKIALLYKGTNKILKYINENEVVFVDEETDVYGVQVVDYMRLDSFIHSLTTR